MNPLSLRRGQGKILNQDMQYPRGQRHLNSILQEPETRATLLAQGYDPAGGSAEDFHRVLGAEVATWSRVIRAVDIRFE
jgi:tripartite-type tricarboxylate transporter receptor subunit TctC